MTNQGEIAISVKDLHKTFKLPHEQHTGIKQLLVNRLKGVKGYEKQHVLQDISFDIKKGDFFGIVGRNGSGKSTLLKLLSGIYAQDKGSIVVNGSLTPFIELGVGFNPELTGRENVYLNGALLGFSKKEMNLMYDSIVEFAELEKFMDQKLKNYSSGMQVRLAFSIAIRSESDILILDEVLAVGDALFQKKCFDYFKKLKRDGRTVVFVSHDTSSLQEYCTHGVLIESGKIIMKGTINQVINKYSDILSKNTKNDAAISSEERWGTGDIIVSDIELLDNRKGTYIDGQDIKIKVSFIAKTNVNNPVYGITLTDEFGKIVFQSNTLWCKIETKNLLKNEKTSIMLSIPNVFNSGKLYVSPAVSDSKGELVYDWIENMSFILVNKKQKSHGYINVDHSLTVIYEK